MLDFRVLGPVEVARDGRALALGGPKPRALLGLLAVWSGGPVSAARLAAELWADHPPPTAAASLHVHLSTLRRAVGDRLRTTRAGYVLDAADEEVDARRFERALARGADEDPGATSARLRAALAEWRGRPFDGVEHGPTIAAEAARLGELRLGALEDRVEADLALGRHQELLPELRGLIEAHPTRERLAGQLMLALHRSDRGADALRVYEGVAAALDEALGVDPGDELAALARAIRRGDPTLARPAPGGLPLPTSSFVGRAAELAELREQLGGTRLLTLLGPGGSGKSRLALELARAVAQEHPGGTFLVGLAGLSVTDSVTRAVAGVVDARDPAGRPLVAAIAHRLDRGRALVLLDDCERLAAECARLCAALLETVPGLRLLTTSREPIGVPGEVVYRVGGLAVGPGGGPPDEADAVRLLVERARAARPGFRLEPGELAAAARICRELDGLPLPIELAAARLRSLSLGELAERLQEHLGAAGGARAARPERHHTIAASIDWSHRMLEADERRLFRRLAVFAAGFGVASLEAVAGIEPAVERPSAVLARLVDRSLVEVSLRPGEAARYRLLEVVRQFAAERLAEAGEEAVARARHADWHARLAAGARQWGGGEQEAWLHRIERDLDNLRAALTWYLGDGWDPDRALQVVCAMWWVWYVRGMIGESRTWLRRVLAASELAGPTPDRAAALQAAAAGARGMGDFADAAELGARALDAQRAVGDERGQAAALNGLCITATALGDLDAALAYAEESLRVIERVGAPRGITTSTLNLGVVLRARGDLERPEALFEAARRGFAEQGDQRGVAAALSNLALLAHRRGEPAAAQRFVLDALARYRQLGFDEGQADCLEMLAFQRAEAEPALALELLTVADRARERLGAAMFVPDERAARAAAEAAIGGALDEEGRSRVVATARRLDLQEVAARLLRPLSDSPPT
ncbi:MAG TPA: BTAD domain-containing putative transcriptional regulator [Candidatus Dormibacteraeota bacterium]|nr:BTAD domain-containing putative transcriptional regulator [Candidatus Dormibacteraeota bacterium]